MMSRCARSSAQGQVFEDGISFALSAHASRLHGHRYVCPTTPGAAGHCWMLFISLMYHYVRCCCPSLPVPEA
jgi:hypothetical protein